MATINRKQYPQLDMLLWDNADEMISEQEAFGAYEKRWPYVDENTLTNHEKELIDRLTKQLGNGLFLSA